MKLLDAMLEHEPPLPWPRNQYVAAFAVDQCNIWQAAKKTKRGAFRGTERLDADGMPVVIRSTTILNIVQREVPFTMGMLTPEELEEIREKGPYTEDYNTVLSHVDPIVVRRQLHEGFSEICALLAVLSQFSEESVTDALLERPHVDVGGRTPMNFLPSIQNCDTKRHQDVFRFIPYLMQHCPLFLAVLIVFGDGQTVEILRACKVRWPAEYKHVLIGNGFFHASSHFHFALNFGFWEACHATFASWLGKEKQIYKEMKDLEHDNAKHIHDFFVSSRRASSPIYCWM
jgi:hypothetical protein